MKLARKAEIDSKVGLPMASAAIFGAPAFLLLLQLVAAYNNGNTNQEANQQEATTYLQRPDQSGRPQLMVAIYCGSGISKSGSLYQNQYLEVESGKWRTDRSATAYCTEDKQEILSYCRKVYPNHDIRNFVESSRSYKIDNWCRVGSSKRKCRTRLSVRPYRCLEGAFQSDALLVPERCLFDHVHNKSVCENTEHWNETATSNCQARDMKLQSFAMLQPCGLGVFSGVEFVCCPRSSEQVSAQESKAKDSASEGNSFAQAANGQVNWPSNPKYDIDEKINSIKTDDEAVKKHNDEADDLDAEEDDEDEYDESEDEYDDDSSSWTGDKSSSSSTTTTTTTTTERPIDHYLSQFDMAHEHDEFRKAELAVESSYKDKINHVMNEWNQLDGRYEEMKKKDPQAAEEFKQKMTRQFKKTIEALEAEGQAQRHQVASMHAERAMAIINRRKKAAMDCLTQALDKIPIKTRQVERCIVRLLKALEKDRSHTLYQYRSLLNLNTHEAIREKKIILDHLVTLNRAANQSITMLDRSPELVDKLKDKIITLWHRLRNVPLNEPILQESELKIMEKYEEEVAERKIERERQRFATQQAAIDSPQDHPANQATSKSPAEHSGNKSNKQQRNTAEVPPSLAPSIVTDKPIELTQVPPVRHEIMAPIPSAAPLSRSPHQLDDRTSNEIHYQSSAKFAHLKADPSHHELSYTIKRDPITGHVQFGYPTLLVSACALVILVAVFGMRHYSKGSSRAYRRQGFAEVGRSCPEEKSMSSLQFNGYENPAYKFFEAEA